MLTFLLGGARSGKSTLAVQMGEHHGGPVTFVATAEPFDDDLRERVLRHRDERPPTWTTVEAPVDLAAAVRATPPEHFLIVDCLTVWMGNVMVHLDAPERITDHVDDFIAALGERRRHADERTVVVSNEVGMGIHPDTALGRRYRDDLGRVNQRVAAIADTSLLLVAGRALRLENPWELLR
ncbi:MAG: bifunctional adenosylcobinamide kinase/adenosylcobinamide-phosphate guanylyltransferase [Actinomycetota bacterium]